MRYVKHGLIMCLFDYMHTLCAFLSKRERERDLLLLLLTFWVPGVSTISKLENIITIFIPCILFKNLFTFF